MSGRTNWDFVNGMLEAMKVIAEVTGSRKVDNFSDEEWKLLCEINAAIAGRAAQLAQSIGGAK